MAFTPLAHVGRSVSSSVSRLSSEVRISAALMPLCTEHFLAGLQVRQAGLEQPPGGQADFAQGAEQSVVGDRHDAVVAVEGDQVADPSDACSLAGGIMSGGGPLDELLLRPQLVTLPQMRLVRDVQGHQPTLGIARQRPAVADRFLSELLPRTLRWAASARRGAHSCAQGRLDNRGLVEVRRQPGDQVQAGGDAGRLEPDEQGGS
jgi:hypothetical protein